MRYDLVFEGGGAKGMVFVGALQELERRGHGYGRLLGTSAGAIAATFTAAGFSAGEMLAALKEKDADGAPVFQKFLGRPRPLTPDEVAASATRAMLKRMDARFLPNVIEDQLDQLILHMMSQAELVHLFSFIERGGWYSADAFLDWARTKLDQAGPDGRARQLSGHTFAGFYEATGRELSLVAADTTDQRMLVFNRHTAPGLPVVWGMRMSMSLPLLWQEVIWQSAWGNYLGRSLAGHRVVDGGLLSNFPIELFLSNDPHVVSLMGPKSGQGVLGLLIDETLKVSGIDHLPAPRPPADSLAGLPPVARIAGLMETATHAHDKMVIEAFEQFVCRLPAKTYFTTEFDMSDERRDRLIDAGRAAMSNYFRIQETQGMKGPDFHEMERALKRADQTAGKILR
jgi:predicted acylesterase/phospholipase RssA